MRSIAIISAAVALLSMLPTGLSYSANKCEWLSFMMNPQHNPSIPDSCAIDPMKSDLLWKTAPAYTETDGRSVEAPAVYKDGYVYYGLTNITAHATFTSKLIKADASTGDIAWTFAFDKPAIRSDQPRAEMRVSGLAASPLIMDDKVFCGSVGGVFYCLDSKTGDVRWSRDFSSASKKKMLTQKTKTGLGIPDRKGITTYVASVNYVRSAPVCGDGKIFFAVNTHAVVVDIRDADETWLEMYPDSLTKCIDRFPDDYKNEIYGISMYKVYSYNPTNNEVKSVHATSADFLEELGKKRYGAIRIPPDDFAQRSALSFNDMKLYINTTIQLICLDLKTNRVSWTLAGNSTHPFFSTPAIKDGLVYYGGPQMDLYVLKESGGGLHWRTDARWSVRNTSTPLVVGDMLYLACRSGEVICIDMKNNEIRWRFASKVKMPIFSSPVLSKGKIWFGSSDHFLYCLDADTGKLMKSIELDGAILASPTVADRKIFIGTDSGTFYCFGENTAVLGTTPLQSESPDDWTCFMGDMQHTGFAQTEAGPRTDELEKHWEYPTGFRVVPTVLVANGMAFAGSQDNYMRAINLADGLEIWRTKVGEKCHHDKRVKIEELKYGGVVSTPVFVDGRIYFGTICHKVLCLDAKTGSIVWEYDDPDRDESFNSAISYSEGKLYVVSSEKIYCIDSATGKRLWVKTVWGNSYSAPMIAEGKVFVAGTRQVMCLDAATGDELLKDGFVHDGKVIDISSPSYRNGLVYFGCMDSDYICFDAKTGKEVWRSRDGRAVTAGCLADGKIFFGDLFGSVSCLDIANGNVLWRFDSNGHVYGAPVFCNGKIYFGSAKGSFYCVETKYGRLAWEFSVKEAKWVNPFGQAFACSPSIAGGKVYIGGVDGNVYCFGDLRKGLILDRVKVTAPSTTAMAGKSLKLKATAYSKDGSVMNGNFAWTVEPDSLGKIGNDGTFTAGAKSGTVFIKACMDGKCDGVKIDIKEPKDIVASVSIDPKSARVFVGTSHSFEATAFDGAGNPVEDIEFSWKVEPTTLGTVKSGVLTAAKSGKGKITATVGARSGSSQIQVVKPLRMSIDPEMATVFAGGSQQFRARVYDDLDEIIDDASVSWKVEPESLGMVNDHGLFIAKGIGQGSVIAEFMGLSAKSPVTVTAPPKSEIAIEPLLLDFGTLHPDQARTLKIRMKNNGEATGKVTLTTDSDWIKISPESTEIGSGDEATADVSLSLSGKTRGSTLEGAIKATTPASVAQIQVKAKVAPLEQCIAVKDENLKGEVSSGVVTTKAFGVESLTGILDARITSTNPLVMPKNPQAKIGKSTQIEIAIDASSLRPGETIAGSLAIKTHDNCLQATVHYLFTVKAGQVRIWLQIGNPMARIDGVETKLQASPVIIKGSTFVPLRFIAEAFGCKVDWDGEKKQITITKGSLSIILVVDRPLAIVSGRELAMKSPPTSIGGRTFVPLRFIAEAFGATVNFSVETKEIDIAYTP